MSNSMADDKMDSPPVISDEALPSTPAREWANNTTSSLNANNDNSIPQGQGVSWMFDSSASTPEGDLPGAYPSGIDRGSPFDPKGAAIGVYNTAKSYIPAQDNVGKAALSASETVKHYLPQSVASYFPSSPTSGAGDGNNYSLPSKELSDERLGTTNGVGPLPGPRTEPGVVLLPDERFENDETIGENSSSSLKDETGSSLLPRKRSSGSGNLANSTSNGIKTSSLTPHTDANHTNGDSLSDISTQAQDGSEVGTTSPLNTPAMGPSPYPTGPIEGGVNNDAARYASVSGDTLHPEQRKDSSSSAADATADDLTSSKSVQQPILNTVPRTHPLAGDGAKWKGVPLSEGYQSQLDANEGRQLNQGAGDNRGPFQTQEPYEESKSGEAKNEAHAVKNKVLGTVDGKPASTGSDVNTNTNSTFADAGHSPEVRSLRDGASTKFHSGTSPHDQKVGTTMPTPSELGKGNGHGSPGKSKFMDRIKGEVKVISGKLAHNDGKVEEGRRLMGKGV